MKRIIVAAALVSLLGASGCFRAGRSRGGNVALVAVGTAIIAGAVIKSQYPLDQDEGAFFPRMGPAVESVVLVGFGLLGLSVAATGVSGLAESSPRDDDAIVVAPLPTTEADRVAAEVTHALAAQDCGRARRAIARLEGLDHARGRGARDDAEISGC